jgi:hypothetical protein
MIFIAFTGVKGSGKTTASGFLKELVPDMQEVTLAKRLKDASSVVLGIPRDDFDNPAVKEKELATPVYLDEKNVAALFDFFKVTPDYDKHIRPHISKVLHSPRRVAQYVGTEVLRNFDEDIHCTGAVIDVTEGGIYVVTDMRFTGEYDFFKTRYGTNFYPYYIQNGLAEKKVDNHPSEMQVFEVAKKCVKLDNNGTLEDLRNRVSQVYQEVMNTRLSKVGG